MNILKLSNFEISTVLIASFLELNNQLIMHINWMTQYFSSRILHNFLTLC